MKWWEWLFDGLGSLIVVGIIGWLMKRFVLKSGTDGKSNVQKIRSGNNSTNVQAGQDAVVRSTDETN